MSTGHPICTADLIRQLLRDELRVKVDVGYSGPVIDNVTVSIWLHDEVIAKHTDYLGWPERKQGLT